MHVFETCVFTFFQTFCTNSTYYLLCRHTRSIENNASGDKNIEYIQPSKKPSVTGTRFVVETIPGTFLRQTLKLDIYKCFSTMCHNDLSYSTLKTSMVMCKCFVNICEINLRFKQPISVSKCWHTCILSVISITIQVNKCLRFFTFAKVHKYLTLTRECLAHSQSWCIHFIKYAAALGW